ncbi:hypothetical protein IJ21_48110 [Paenibacillus sp. 32O-W]|uniref:hypothetical protein n=1 Tax=Paenibacillus cisolokensis TaxID=1658519 RepID=UPI00072097DB|nr:hypothetical protein [Paenibacillus cisolokensis]ALS30172.1 hypothetical protein IJ21_48110 [Paenibacillus sp. 32O-W]
MNNHVDVGHPSTAGNKFGHPEGQEGDFEPGGFMIGWSMYGLTAGQAALTEEATR